MLVHWQFMLREHKCFLFFYWLYYHPKGFQEAGACTEIRQPAAMAKPKNKACAHICNIRLQKKNMYQYYYYRQTIGGRWWYTLCILCLCWRSVPGRWQWSHRWKTIETCSRLCRRPTAGCWAATAKRTRQTTPTANHKRWSIHFSISFFNDFFQLFVVNLIYMFYYRFTFKCDNYLTFTLNGVFLNTINDAVRPVYCKRLKIGLVSCLQFYIYRWKFNWRYGAKLSSY